MNKMMPMLAVVTAACVGGGGGSGGGGGGSAPGGAVGGSCTSAQQGEGCTAGLGGRVRCDPATNQWTDLGACPAGQHCTVAGSGAAAVSSCVDNGRAVGQDAAASEDADATSIAADAGSPPGKLAAGSNGQPCTPATQNVGCAVDGSVMTCNPKDQAWSYDKFCEDGCLSGVCGGTQIAYCGAKGVAFKCPAGLAASGQGHPCSAATQKVGCAFDGSVMTCDPKSQAWSYDKFCEDGCLSGVCGGTQIAYCAAKGVAFKCPAGLAASGQGHPCSAATQKVGCASDGSVMTCDPKSQAWSYDKFCEEGCVSGNCGGTQIAYCAAKGVAFKCPAGLAASGQGHPCSAATQKVGCASDGSVMTCDPKSQAWSYDKFCEEGCLSGNCGGTQIAYCAAKGVAFKCPAGLAASGQGHPCTAATQQVGCAADGSVMTCDPKNQVWSYDKFCEGSCLSGTCGGVQIAYCGAKGEAFKCP